MYIDFLADHFVSYLFYVGTLTYKVLNSLKLVSEAKSINSEKRESTGAIQMNYKTTENLRQ